MTAKKRPNYLILSVDKGQERFKMTHCSFIREGTAVAFQLCFPGASSTIPLDASRITALTATPGGTVYGGTAGSACHLFFGRFTGVNGMVFDMGAVPDCNECAAICCANECIIACVNGPDGGRIIQRERELLHNDLIQEWAFFRRVYHDLGHPVQHERIHHAVTALAQQMVVGTTERHLFYLDIKSQSIHIVGKLENSGRLVRGVSGIIYGKNHQDCLWAFNPADLTLSLETIKLPKEGLWKDHHPIWARHPIDGSLFTTDARGTLFQFHEAKGFSRPLGQTPFTPVTSMAVTFDGRLYGTCGREIQHLFGYYPQINDTRDLGAFVSVINRRRYGYEFSDAVTGVNGEIIFGENDNQGHLWLYFPRIQKRKLLT